MQIGAVGSYGTSAYGIGYSAYSSGVNSTGAAGTSGEQVGGAASAGQVEECQTCKERKYQDGSNENVSFKSAAHISPESAATTVRNHEGEHVANAYDKAEQKGGEVVSATVSLHTSVCPECGRTYVSGGTTNTTIKYNESNPYSQAQKTIDSVDFAGRNIDYSA